MVAMFEIEDLQSSSSFCDVPLPANQDEVFENCTKAEIPSKETDVAGRWFEAVSSADTEHITSLLCTQNFDVNTVNKVRRALSKHTRAF